jgi:flagellar biosynthetic protein FliR
MMPAGFAGIEDQLWLWLVAMIRPGAAFLAAPIFGAAFVPLQIRAIVALAIGIPGLALSSFHLPAEGLATMAGFLLVAGEIIAGLAIGFAVQIGFSCALVSGEVIGNAMGLGFAAMMDPASGQQNPVLGQFLMIVATLLFLAMDGHLMLARVIVESYHALPPGNAWLSAEAIRGLVFFGAVLFSAGLSIALPVAFAIILVQIVMGLLARSAPQLNLFAVGFPAALLAGIVLLAIAAPVLGEGINAAIGAGLDEARRLALGG